ncbi:MAG: hypothetical protein GY940_34780, partial [bacterium]|nr:hypothetical protein [bacterium]
GSKDNNRNPISLTGSLVWHNKKLSIDDFRFNWRGNGQLLVKGELYPDAPKKRNQLRITMMDINLQLLSPFVDLKQLDPQNRLLQSTVFGSIDLSGYELSLKGIDGKCHFRVKPRGTAGVGQLAADKKNPADTAGSGELEAILKDGAVRLNIKEVHVPGVVKFRGQLKWPLLNESLSNESL